MGQLTRNYLHIGILLIEDNSGDVRLVREMLAEAKGVSFKLECANYLSAGLKLLESGNFDLLLLDLNLPDSYGLETFEKARSQVPKLPIIILRKAAFLESTLPM